MSSRHCIETATFRLKAGIPDEALLDVEKRVRGGQISREPGYLSRELAKADESGQWLLVMRFETRAELDAWMSKVKTVPEMRALGELLDPTSMITSFYESLEPT